MAQQLDLFRAPRRPQRQNEKTMWVYDAGEGLGGREIIRMRCQVCGFVSDWLASRGPTIELKGRVCPKCRGKGQN